MLWNIFWRLSQNIQKMLISSSAPVSFLSDSRKTDFCLLARLPFLHAPLHQRDDSLLPDDQNRWCPHTRDAIGQTFLFFFQWVMKACCGLYWNISIWSSSLFVDIFPTFRSVIFANPYPLTLKEDDDDEWPSKIWSNCPLMMKRTFDLCRRFDDKSETDHKVKMFVVFFCIPLLLQVEVLILSSDQKVSTFEKNQQETKKRKKEGER